MSSPSVLTFSSVPLEQARTNNRLVCEEYSAKAAFVYEQLRPRIERLRSAGERVAVETPEEANAAAAAAFGNDGKEAVVYLHRYWQRLKHEWGPAITQQLLEVEAAERWRLEREREKERVRRENEQRRTEDRARAATAMAGTLQGGFDEKSFDPGALGAPGETRAERVERLCASIEGYARELGDPRATLQLEHAMRLDERGRVAALELLEGSLADLASRQRRKLAYERLRIEDERAQLVGRLTTLRHASGQLPNDDAEEIVAAVEELLAALDAPAFDATALDEAIADLERRRRDFLSSRELRSVVERELARLGYRRVTQMRTLTPSDIRSRGGNRVVFSRQDDPDAFVEVDAVEELLSMQVVWATEDHSVGATRRKTNYQNELCAAVDRIEERLRDIPGAEVRIRERRDVNARAVPVRKALSAMQQKNASKQLERSATT